MYRNSSGWLVTKYPMQGPRPARHPARAHQGIGKVTSYSEEGKGKFGVLAFQHAVNTRVVHRLSAPGQTQL